MNAYAKALEIIPRQLADNAGFDATDVLNKLRQKHAAKDGSGKDFGVDINSGTLFMPSFVSSSLSICGSALLGFGLLPLRVWWTHIPAFHSPLLQIDVFWNCGEHGRWDNCMAILPLWSGGVALSSLGRMHVTS